MVFIDDYNGLDYGRDGKANMAWTDMRRFTTVEDVSGYAQNIAFVRADSAIQQRGPARVGPAPRCCGVD